MPPLAPMQGTDDRGSPRMWAKCPAIVAATSSAHVSPAAEVVLHVVAEHGEEVRIADEVQEAAMEEKCRHQRQAAVAGRLIGNQSEGPDGLL